MRPLLLAGPAGSGKDHAARYLAARWNLAAHHLAAPLYALVDSPSGRHAVKRLAGDDLGRQAEVRRRFLQGAGDLYRNLSPTLLVDCLVDRAAADAPRIVVPDLRLPEELAGLRRHWPDALLIYCDVPEAIRQERLAARDGAVLSFRGRNHDTEVAVLALKSVADIVWDNSGDWATTAQRLLDQVTSPLLGCPKTKKRMEG